MGRAIMRLLIILIFLVYPYGGMAYENEIKSMVLAIKSSITKSGKKSAAVMDFTDLRGSVTELGKFLAEEVSVNLALATRRFDVIDRAYLRRVLKDQRIYLSDLGDLQVIKRIGQVVGVEAVVVGTVTPFEDKVRVSVKVVATDTGSVIGAGSRDIPRVGVIEELLVRGSEAPIAKRGEVEAPVSYSSGVSSASKSEQTVQQREVDYFLFELQGCRIVGQEIICYFLITNRDVEKDLELIADGWNRAKSSRIFDEFENVYEAVEVQFANRESRFSATSSLATGVPTKASLKFKGVSKNVKSIALLEISCRTGKDFNRKDFIVQFRNIPLLR